MRRKFSLRELLVVAYKAAVYILLFIIFISIMGIHNASLTRLSRTAGVTYFVFALMMSMMTVIYGGFDIGIKKSKPIFYSVLTAAVFTDLAAYLALMIMNTNPSNNTRFRLDDLDYLLLAVLIQALVIRLMAYGGNALYFRMYKPKQTLIVAGDGTSDTTRVKNYLSTYKKQYKILLEVGEHHAGLEQMISNYDFVVFVDVSGQRRHQLASVCYRKAVPFAYAPSVVDTIEMGGNFIVYDDKPMVEVSTKPMTLSQQLQKRVLDLFISIIGSILISPVILLVAIAIKLDDGGAVFYRQERLTLDGVKFRIIKFRTMKPNDNRTLATVDDDRITRVGKILRRMRLDELPQIYNILLGHMSVVGPRPEQEFLFKQYEADFPEFAYRLRVKAGLTGEAQIAGKYNTSPRDKLLLDLSYIQNYTIWLDIKLIFQTVTVFFKKDSTEGISGDGDVGVAKDKTDVS